MAISEDATTFTFSDREQRDYYSQGVVGRIIDRLHIRIRPTAIRMGTGIIVGSNVGAGDDRLTRKSDAMTNETGISLKTPTRTVIIREVFS
ncbi:MAG: hypothetical protein ACE5H4_07395 [Candidatus Thorarchaeota archaeon]